MMSWSKHVENITANEVKVRNANFQSNFTRERFQQFPLKGEFNSNEI